VLTSSSLFPGKEPLVKIVAEWATEPA